MLDAVDGFARRHLPPEEVRRRDQAHEPPDDLLPALAELGVTGLPIPDRYGGLGKDWETVALVQERLGYQTEAADRSVAECKAWNAMRALIQTAQASLRATAERPPVNMSNFEKCEKS